MRDRYFECNQMCIVYSTVAVQYVYTHVYLKTVVHFVYPFRFIVVVANEGME